MRSVELLRGQCFRATHSPGIPHVRPPHATTSSIFLQNNSRLGTFSLSPCAKKTDLPTMDQSDAMCCVLCLLRLVIDDSSYSIRNLPNCQSKRAFRTHTHPLHPSFLFFCTDFSPAFPNDADCPSAPSHQKTRRLYLHHSCMTLPTDSWDTPSPLLSSESGLITTRRLYSSLA